MGNHQFRKRRYNLRGILVGSFVVLWVVTQLLMIPPLGSAQEDYNCPVTLTDNDCEVLWAAQIALDEAGSVHVAAYGLSADIDLDSDSISLRSSGSGDVLLKDGEIEAADFRFEDATFISPETQFEGDGILRLVDGVIYLGTGEEEEAIGWVGTEIDAIVPELAFLGGFSALLEELNDVPTVITWARDEDFVVDETLVAVFYMDFSARGLLQSSVFVERLAEGLAGIFADSFEEDLVSPALATAVVSELANQLSEDIGDEYIFRITQLISVEDFHIRRITLELDFTMDLGFLAGFTTSVDGESPESLTVALNFDATFGQYGGNVSIEGAETYDDISDDIAGLFDSLLTDIIGGIGIGEDNDTSSNAGDSVELIVNESIMGMLAANSGPDSYRFEAYTGDIVQIAVRADESSNLDTYLQLFDADGERIADNDDALSPPSEFDLGTFDSYIEYEIVEDGIYFVEVSSVFTVDAGSYTLALRIE